LSLHNILGEERPRLLQGQLGFEFFSIEPQLRHGDELRFFARGKVQDRRYFDQVVKLGAFLWQMAERVGSKDTGVSYGTVYLAKPASDMREAYISECFYSFAR
jgi:hypothetical protein